MKQQTDQQLIQAYIKAYNAFDIAGMLATLHPSIEFTNISGGEITLDTKGIEAFETQARQGAQFFRQRTQTITDIQADNETVEVLIDYQAVLAQDLPNGLKAGDTLNLKGKSIFRFKDGLIITIEDIS